MTTDERPLAQPDLVAIDGPSASGKSTVARRLATELGWAYLDTGATYRSLTWAALGADIPADDSVALTDLATALTTSGRLQLTLDPVAPAVQLDGTDISAEIRGKAATAAVSAVSAHPGVRKVLVAWQRQLAYAAGRCVLEGRDTGAVVVPHARLKVWLTARPDVRASRRADEAGPAAGADLARRDAHDAGRAVDPMQPAADALVLDSSERSVDEIVVLLLDQLAVGKSR